MDDYDVIVIGGGIAGVSLAYELTYDRKVAVLETESTLAFHTTGRSAATFLETHGGQDIRALTTASRDFFEHPPEFFESALISSHPMLTFARPGRGAALHARHREVLALAPASELLTGAEVEAVVPFVRPGFVENAIYDPTALDLDVHGLHQGYVRGLRARGGEIRKSAQVTALTRVHDRWNLTLADHTAVTAAVVVNAAGAWADHVAVRAGVRQLGMVPMLRTIFMIPRPERHDAADEPLFGDLDQSFYLKPEQDQVLCSPADETPTAPGDVRADTLEIARALDDINLATTLAARRVTHSWAGLRTFAPDRNFVVGFDSEVEGFFWFAGQGGYGIQTSPATARLGAALLRGHGAPAEIIDRGLDLARLAPDRPGL